MALTLLFPIGAKIGVVQLDASLNETHETEADVTEHQVERGARIADHKRKLPARVTIEGLVTNTPVGRAAQTRAVEFTGGSFQSATSEDSPFGVPGYAEEAFAKLEDLFDSEELITVVTSLKTYENMAITKLTVPRDRSTGDALRFTVALKEVVIVENRVTFLQAAPADPRATKKVRRGRQAKFTMKAGKALRKAGVPWTASTVENVGAPIERATSGSFDKLRASLGRVLGV